MTSRTVEEIARLIVALQDKWTSKASDGLPIASFDARSIAATIAHCDIAVSTIAAPMPRMTPIDVSEIAICVAMAGCNASALPIIVKAIEAMAHPEFNSLGVLTTTGNASVGILVHGPIATTVGISSAANCLGPVTAQNAAVGRALSICIRLLFDCFIGGLDMATLGQPAKFGLCFAEGENPAPWSSLPFDRGITNESAVTVFACGGIVEVADLSAVTGAQLLESMCSNFVAPLLRNGFTAKCSYLYVLPPEWAEKLARDGWTRESIARHVATFVQSSTDYTPQHLRSSSNMALEAPSKEFQLHQFLSIVAGGIGGKSAILLPWLGGSVAITVSL